MKIVLIGAGNVGYHLGRELHRTGEKVVQVFSRKRYKANKLAKLIGAKATTSLDRIDENADLYILAVHDDAIFDVAKKLAAKKCREKLIVHTSGFTPKTIFGNIGLSRFGVFYPLQTFSISKEPDFEKIPFCLDANNKKDIVLLKNLARKISKKIFLINDEQRATIHIAAVFVCNFANHLYHIADDILKKKNIPMDILLPLIEETVDKIKTNAPADMQTGPAIRGDKKTIKKHIEKLESNPNYKKIYEQLTKSIQASAL